MSCPTACPRNVALLAAAGLWLTACASPPPRYIDGVNFVTAQQHVRDASVQRIDGWPCLRVNAELAERLRFAMFSDDLEAAREAGLYFLDHAHALALDTTKAELTRLDADGWETLTTHYPEAGGDPSTAWHAFAHDTDTQAARVRAAVTQAATVNDLRDALRPLAEAVEKPVKWQGRVARALPWFLFTVPSQMVADRIHRDEYRGSMDTPFASSVMYGLASVSAPAPKARDAAHWDLLVRYAPRIVQEIPAAPAYEPDSDRVGTVVATDDEQITIDTGLASVYAYAREVYLDDHPHVQLTYTHWYPAHPKLKGFDPEAGHLEGVTLRITLDRDEQPALFETLYNCGCFHRVYPIASLEAKAAAEHGQALPGKTHALERAVHGLHDFILPNTVDDAVLGHDGQATPIIRVRAGWHGIVDVALDDTRHADEPRTVASYALRPYAELEQLRTPAGRVVSMFYDNGLARGAQRLEGVFFTPIGMLSAGQPRQRGTQLILWDHWDFDDPQLLRKGLRLPESF